MNEAYATDIKFDAHFESRPKSFLTLAYVEFRGRSAQPAKQKVFLERNIRIFICFHKLSRETVFIFTMY